MSGYHSWRRRPISTRTQQDALLEQCILDAHQRSKGQYGAPRIHAVLQAQGQRVCRKRAARLMRSRGRRAKGKRRLVRTTDSGHAVPVCPNLLARQFEVQQPNQVWASDLRCLPTTEGWLYLAVTLDVHSRAVVGDAMDTQMTATLPLAALHRAARRRRPYPGLVRHSDRGGQYASGIFQAEVARMRAKSSMSRKGDCWNNAVMESFFSSLKWELMGENIFDNRPLARQAVLEFTEVFANRQRRHSTLGDLTPHELERPATAA